jgi:hypothetical protein
MDNHINRNPIGSCPQTHQLIHLQKTQNVGTCTWWGFSVYREKRRGSGKVPNICKPPRHTVIGKMMSHYNRSTSRLHGKPPPSNSTPSSLDIHDFDKTILEQYLYFWNSFPLPTTIDNVSAQKDMNKIETAE